MSSATSSGTSNAVTAAEVAYYRENGFVRVRNIISREEAERFRVAALESESRMKANCNSDIFTQYVNVWRESAAMKELTLHPRVLAAASELAGVSLRLWHDQLLIKRPKKAAATEFHQDQPYWPHANSLHSLSIWIALCDVPVERGCMTFIPESFKRRDLPMQHLNDPRSLFAICPDMQWDERVTIPLRAGDCTFHHSRCAHMANPNITNEVRVAHAAIYMDATTTYMAMPHPVTDPLNLLPGQVLDQELFPEVDRLL